MEERGSLRMEHQFGELNWEPIKAFRTRLTSPGGRAQSPSSSPVEILEGIKNSEFVEKVKSSLVSWSSALDVPELLAYLVRQSESVLDQVGRRDLRIASVLQSTGHHYEGGFWSDSTLQGRAISNGALHHEIGLRKSGFKTDFKISFYPPRGSSQGRRSIIPVEILLSLSHQRDADIAILEGKNISSQFATPWQAGLIGASPFCCYTGYQGLWSAMFMV
ncbi:Digalactosyldiacylglycerol synthase 1, chloroplastic [Datura stramonium]|uniref:Digalactosyldiacylglycerol synthase 1, chloroplastic n=1 Tax=Datura stramonium TaxID=4076 RepID=A0ABS8VJI9_DATST|nr:Digalactosyldiacylglycerol synthase 1, chloroplastic [Datura stramonium]